MVQIDSRMLDGFFSDVGSNIYDEAEKTVNAFSMQKYIESGVLVGLSGGADSVLLLCFLLEYRRRHNLDFSIACVHINHGIRGEEADRDEAFCADLCRSLGVELIVKGFDVPSLARGSHTSLEESARIVRYSAFSNIIQGRNDICAIAVAHNMSDNAETVIFNVLRGSGARGASGINPVRDNIIRPLISISKADIISALDTAKIPYVTDSTNSSCEYTRNYIRHEIIPRLRRITDDPEKMLLRFSSNLRCDDDFINSFADSFINGRDEITNKELSGLHYSVFIRVLKKMASRYKGEISARVASDIYALLVKDNFSYSLIGNAAFVCERGVCRVSGNSGSLVDYCFEGKEGVTHLDPFNADFVLSESAFEKTFLNVYKISIQANLSSAIISGSLYLRPKKDGDTVFYGGMTHKLKKLFSDAKIPASKRKLLPILCDDKGVVWVPGFGVRDDGVPKEERKNLYVLLGIRPDDAADGERLYLGSEFR